MSMLSGKATYLARILSDLFNQVLYQRVTLKVNVAAATSPTFHQRSERPAIR